jgi:carboxymethylenebutenolidase
MRTEVVDVSAADGTADSYLVVPDDGPHPGVLLFMDAFGLRRRIEEMAERIADAGYGVLAPNLLYRGGRSPLVDMSGMDDPSQREKVIGQVMPLVKSLDNAAIIRDAECYLDFIHTVDGIDDSPVVITGYCMGGMNALRVIEAFPDRVRAAAGFHPGGLVTDASDSPHLRVGDITGEVYFGFADNDPSMNSDQIATLERALDDAGVTHRCEIYENASHGYTMSDTASYDAAAENRHWDNLFALLQRTHA